MKKVVKKEVVKKEIKAKTTLKKKTRKTKKVKKKVILVKSKRKTAIATAKIEIGKGRVVINKKPLDVIENTYILALVKEPVLLANQYNPDLLKGVNISVNVKGGGQISQIIASRACISKGLVKFYDDKKLHDLFLKYDKTLVVDDARRKEAKKQLGRGARARWQSSKR